MLKVSGDWGEQGADIAVERATMGIPRTGGGPYFWLPVAKPMYGNRPEDW